MAFYGLPLPDTLIELETSDAQLWAKGVKFEFQTLPVSCSFILTQYSNVQLYGSIFGCAPKDKLHEYFGIGKTDVICFAVHLEQNENLKMHWVRFCFLSLLPLGNTLEK